MAWYCAETLWYRGRRVSVMFRYDCFHGARVVEGKTLRLTRRDIRRIKRLLRRKKLAFGENCDHSCGGPVFD